MKAAPTDSGVLDARMCVMCGYDLRGQVDPRCPECGTPFDPGEMPVPDIPWVRRAETGVLWAYWATVTWVLFSPRVAARTIGAARVFLAATSHRFRHAVIWQAVATTAVIASITLLRATGDTSGPAITFALFLAALSVPGAVLFFWAASSVDPLPRGWWTRPILADQAAALHHFAMAPAALLPVAAIAEIVALALHLAQRVQAARQVHNGAMLAYAALVCAWGAWTVLMMRASRLWEARDLTAAALLLPARWTILAVFVTAMTFLLTGGLVVLLGLISRM
jgi:hypothetical protein